MVRDEVMRKRGYNTGLILRHERGHCNGWDGYHTGGRPAYSTYWVPERERMAVPRDWLEKAEKIRAKLP